MKSIKQCIQMSVILASALALAGCISAKSHTETEPALAAPAIVDFIDSDGDGIADELDECPNTPVGFPVNEFGCELDSDGDGVKDSQDQCPNTPVGVTVDNKGCEVIYRLEGAGFDNNKSTLKPSAIAHLEQAALLLKENPNRRFEIAGHTDSKGSERYNYNLGSRRAVAVLNFFLSRGLRPLQFSVRSYGETSPVATNDTEAGRALNRRVEIIDITQ